MRVLVCGGRDYDDEVKFNREMDNRIDRRDVIISGGAHGADAFARAWAMKNGVPFIEVPAQWEYYGRSAGPKRNGWMLEHCRPELVLAFPGGHGTANMIQQAEDADISVIRIL